MSGTASSIVAILQTGVAPAIIVGIVLWNADKAISKAGAENLYKAIRQSADSPSESKVAAAIDGFLTRYFADRLGTVRFFRNVFVLTASSLLILLSIYAYKTPGMTSVLLTKGFLRQFIGNGFVVTFLVNCATFLAYPLLTQRISRSSVLQNCGFVALDIVGKATLFIILTAITYALFALFGSAFGGDVVRAVGAVSVTLSGAIRFNNLTSVYFYSVLISSFPIWVVILIQLMAKYPGLSRLVQLILFWLPFDTKPLRAISVVFAALAGLFAFTISVLLIPF